MEKILDDPDTPYSASLAFLFEYSEDCHVTEDINCQIICATRYVLDFKMDMVHEMFQDIDIENDTVLEWVKGLYHYSRAIIYSFNGNIKYKDHLRKAKKIIKKYSLRFYFRMLDIGLFGNQIHVDDVNKIYDKIEEIALYLNAYNAYGEKLFNYLNFLRSNGEKTKVIPLLKKIYGIGEKYEILSLMRIAQIQLGNEYMNNSRHEEAIELFKESIKFFKEDERSYISTKLTMSWAYFYLDQFNLGYQILSSIEDRIIIDSTSNLKAMYFHVLSLAYKRKGKITESIEYKKQEVELYKSLQSNSRSAWATIEQAQTYKLIGMFEEAIVILQEAFDNHEHLPKSKINLLYEIYDTYEEMFSYSNLLNIKKKIDDLIKGINPNSYTQIYHMKILGDFALLNNNIQSSLEYYNEAIRISRERNDNFDLRGKILLVITDVYRIKEDYEIAWDFLDQAYELFYDQKDKYNLLRTVIKILELSHLSREIPDDLQHLIEDLEYYCDELQNEFSDFLYTYGNALIISINQERDPSDTFQKALELSLSNTDKMSVIYHYGTYLLNKLDNITNPDAKYSIKQTMIYLLYKAQNIENIEKFPKHLYKRDILKSRLFKHYKDIKLLPNFEQTDRTYTEFR